MALLLDDLSASTRTRDRDRVAALWGAAAGGGAGDEGLKKRMLLLLGRKNSGERGLVGMLLQMTSILGAGGGLIEEISR